MKKIFTLVVAAVAAFCAAQAETLVYDTLTVQSLNIDLVSGSYGAYTSQFASGAEYYAYSMRNPQVVQTTLEDGTVKKDTVGYNIQLRGNKKNPYSGIVVTKSAGVLREVIFNWSNNTTASRNVDVYSSENPFVDANCLHPDSTGRQNPLVASDSLIYNADKELVFAGGQTAKVEGDVEYFGICMHGTTAAYFSSIIIGWGSKNAVAIEQVNASAKAEKIFNLKGEAVKEMGAGVYVRDGRKVIIR